MSALEIIPLAIELAKLVEKAGHKWGLLEHADEYFRQYIFAVEEECSKFKQSMEEAFELACSSKPNVEKLKSFSSNKREPWKEHWVYSSEFARLRPAMPAHFEALQERVKAFEEAILYILWRIGLSDEGLPKTNPRKRKGRAQGSGSVEKGQPTIFSFNELKTNVANLSGWNQQTHRLWMKQRWFILSETWQKQKMDELKASTAGIEEILGQGLRPNAIAIPFQNRLRFIDDIHRLLSNKWFCHSGSCHPYNAYLAVEQGPQPDAIAELLFDLSKAPLRYVKITDTTPGLQTVSIEEKRIAEAWEAGKASASESSNKNDQLVALRTGNKRKQSWLRCQPISVSSLRRSLIHSSHNEQPEAVESTQQLQSSTPDPECISSANLCGPLANLAQTTYLLPDRNGEGRYCVKPNVYTEAHFIELHTFLAKDVYDYRQRLAIASYIATSFITTNGSPWLWLEDATHAFWILSSDPWNLETTPYVKCFFEPFPENVSARDYQQHTLTEDSVRESLILLAIILLQVVHGRLLTHCGFDWSQCSQWGNRIYYMAAWEWNQAETMKLSPVLKKVIERCLNSQFTASLDPQNDAFRVEFVRLVVNPFSEILGRARRSPADILRIMHA